MDFVLKIKTPQRQRNKKEHGKMKTRKMEKAVDPRKVNLKLVAGKAENQSDLYGETPKVLELTAPGTSGIGREMVWLK